MQPACACGPRAFVFPSAYFLAFTWIAIVALGFSLLSDFWLPMLVGGIGVTLLVRLALPSR